jgi:hypothetical protein
MVGIPTINCLRVPPSGFAVRVYSLSLVHSRANPHGVGDFLLGFTPLAFCTPVLAHRQWGFSVGVYSLSRLHSHANPQAVGDKLDGIGWNNYIFYIPFMYLSRMMRS